jgi:hypothetical protein
MNKFIYLFAILGSLALSTAQIVEPDLSNDGNGVLDAATVDGPNEEVGILTPFGDDLPVDGDSDYYKNGEDYGGIYEGYFESAEGFVGGPDDLNDDLGYVQDPIVAEEFVGLVDVPEPLSEEDATIGEAVLEPSEDPFQFNHIPNSALDNGVGEEFYESWEAIVDSPDDIISEEGFIDYPDALIEFEEATVDVPEALVDFEEGAVGEPEPLIDLEEGIVGLPDDLVDFESGEADYPEALFESGEDFSEALVDYPDNLFESGEDVSEALTDYPDDLFESGEDFTEADVDYPDDLFESEEVTVDISEAYVSEPDDLVESVESSDDFGEADYPDGLIESEEEEEVVEEPSDEFGEADYPDGLIESEEEEEVVEEPSDDFGEADYPDDLIEEEAEVDEPEAVIDVGEVDEPEDEEIGFAIDSKPVVIELDPRVLDTNEEKSKNFLG